jgi:hypothetical protein
MEVSVTIELKRSRPSTRLLRDGWKAKVKGTDIKMSGLYPGDTLEAIGLLLEDRMEALG